MAEYGEAEAQSLLDAGWRQGSMFTANETVGLPHGFVAGQRLVVLTQSCTVVSSGWGKDPSVEIAGTSEVEKFSARSAQATGKDFRKLHVPVDAPGYEAVAVDVNSRVQVPRAMLLEFGPDGPQPEAAVGRDIGGWMARIYSRIALPNALVSLLRTTCIPAIEAALKAKSGGTPLADRVRDILVSWSPDDEVGRPYEVSFQFLAYDQVSAEAVDRVLVDILPIKTDDLHVDGEALSINAVFLSDIEGRTRFTEWDYLSGLVEEAARH